jgi:hypothetical protein
MAVIFTACTQRTSYNHQSNALSGRLHLIHTRLSHTTFQILHYDEYMHQCLKDHRRRCHTFEAQHFDVNVNEVMFILQARTKIRSHIKNPSSDGYSDNR